MDLQLQGRNALVTGGTKGIGRAIVETLAGEGCNIATCARNDEEVVAMVESVRGMGVEATGSVVDICDERAVKDFVSASAGTLGGLDIIVSNVGAMAIGPDRESWMKNIELDIFGLLALVESSMEHLEHSAKQHGDAAIIAIGSTALTAAGSAGSYGPVKAAIVHFIKGLAKQCAPNGIRANVVSPGMVFFEGGVWDRIKANKPEVYKSQLARNPMGRMGDPQDIANAVTFLASPKAEFISGTHLVVDGAMTDRVHY
jgi:3-oxoacyl-[acyl-carrier protein] reductase